MDFRAGTHAIVEGSDKVYLNGKQVKLLEYKNNKQSWRVQHELTAYLVKETCLKSDHNKDSIKGAVSVTVDRAGQLILEGPLALLESLDALNESKEYLREQA